MGLGRIPMANDVFISHSSKDKVMADAICAGLEARGIRCWIAPRDVLPGVEWTKSIVEAISDCKVFLLIFSENSNQSAQAIKEVDCAVNHEKTIIPFRIEDIRPSGSMEYYLASLHWMDAITPPIENHIIELADYIGRNINVPITTPIVSIVAKKSDGKTKGKNAWLWLTGVGILAVGMVATALILGEKLPKEPFFAQETSLTEPASPSQTTTTNTIKPPTSTVSPTLHFTPTPKIITAKMVRNRNCYETTREDSPVVFLYSEGDIVTVLGQDGMNSSGDGGWINIKYEGNPRLPLVEELKDCWIPNKYVEIQGNQLSLPQFTPRPATHMIWEAKCSGQRPDGSTFGSRFENENKEVAIAQADQFCKEQRDYGNSCTYIVEGKYVW